MKKLSQSFKLLESCVFFILVLFTLNACESEEIKLNRGDRFFIDTTASKEINRLSKELDKLCADSSEILIKRITDSLILVREQEILQKALQVQ